MNVGDVVKYVGVEIAEKSGKFLSIWMPYYGYDKGDVGVIYEKRTLNYNMLEGMQTVEKYDVRMISKYNNLIHDDEVFYEFELEKA